MRVRVVTVMVLVLSLTGCAQPSDSEKTGENVAALQHAVQTLQRQIAALAERVDADEGNIGSLQIAQSGSDWTKAEFDPTDSSYERIDAISGVGTFAVSVKDFRPFGDGVRVTLDLGNLTSATIDGATLNMTYGPRRPPALPPSPSLEETQKFNDWQNALRLHAQQILTSLRPGGWNPVTVTLPQIDPKNFGYLQVEISTSQISLYQ